MSARVAKWVGGALTTISVIGLGAYFARVGLDKADKIASVTGAFIGLAGLALTIYGIVTGSPSQARQQPTPATRTSGAVHSEIHEGTFHSPVFQGRDFQQVDLTSQPQQPPPQGPGAPAAE
jgi:hypothetical protein